MKNLFIGFGFTPFIWGFEYGIKKTGEYFIVIGPLTLGVAWGG
jgi:hypothetical protein